MKLTLMMITQLEPHARPFVAAAQRLARECKAEFVLGLDRAEDAGLGFMVKGEFPRHQRIVHVDARGCLENVLDEVVEQCHGDYVLRLDDDERCSPAMEAWLRNGDYQASDHWKFPRAHLWPAPKPSMLKTPHLWPDEQTRLSVRAKAGGRTVIHAGSPFGGGELAPVLIEHHKFLVKTKAERQAIVLRYETVAQGAGQSFLVFSVPEDYYKGESVKLIPLNDGRTDLGYYQQGCGGCGRWITL
jgi:hypothetical protein